MTVDSRTCVLASAVNSLLSVMVTVKVALNAGSSKHGNALRASVDSNCVTYETG